METMLSMSARLVTRSITQVSSPYLQNSIASGRMPSALC
jgi:hypothetical protein